MRRVYAVLSGLLLLAILAQFYFAAVGAFDKPRDDDSFALHSVTGMMIIPVLSILATVFAALARASGRLIGMTILPLGLVVVQVLIIVLGEALTGTTDQRTTPGGLAILGLHAINALAMMGVAGYVFRRARTLASGPPSSSPGSRSAASSPAA